MDFLRLPYKESGNNKGPRGSGGPSVGLRPGSDDADLRQCLQDAGDQDTRARTVRLHGEPPSRSRGRRRRLPEHSRLPSASAGPAGHAHTKRDPGPRAPPPDTADLITAAGLGSRAVAGHPFTVHSRVVHARSDRRKIFCPGSPFLPPFVVSARDARFKRGGAEPSPRRLAPALRAWLRQTLQTTPRQTLQTNLSCHPPRRSLPPRRVPVASRSGIAPWLQP